jgi:hypothetical protein
MALVSASFWTIGQVRRVSEPLGSGQAGQSPPSYLNDSLTLAR